MFLFLKITAIYSHYDKGYSCPIDSTDFFSNYSITYVSSDIN